MTTGNRNYCDVCNRVTRRGPEDDTMGEIVCAVCLPAFVAGVKANRHRVKTVLGIRGGLFG